MFGSPACHLIAVTRLLLHRFERRCKRRNILRLRNSIVVHVEGMIQHMLMWPIFLFGIRWFPVHVFPSLHLVNILGWTCKIPTSTCTQTPSVICPSFRHQMKRSWASSQEAQTKRVLRSYRETSTDECVASTDQM